MADDRKDSEQTGQERSQDRGQPPAMDNQGAEGSFGGQSSGSESTASANPGGGISGQPIGGNDSNTGSGTTLTAGYTPASNQNGAAQSPPQAQGSSQSGDAAATKTMDKADHSMAEKSWDKDQNSGGSGEGQQASRDSQAGFVGSQSSDSGDYVQKQEDSDDNATRSQDRGSDQSGSGNNSQ
jgi:hypothetical protein